MLATSASSEGKVETVEPKTTVTTEAGESEAEEAVQVKFDNDDLIGWLGTGLTMIFDRHKHDFVMPSLVAETITEDAKIAVFADWGTGPYGALVIANTIRNLPRCDVVLHLGDT